MKRNILIASLIAIIFVVISLHPLRKACKEIECMVLECIPYKTELGTAKEIAEYNGWEVEYINQDNGYTTIEGRDKKCIGKKYMRIYLGRYRNIFETDVVAFLMFDVNSELMHVIVKKYTDGL